MEQTLKKLDETWKTVEFGFDKHQDTDVYLINLAEENFEMLEENQLIVQGMMASKFLATFEDWVVGWQKKLSSVSDILAQMQETQRKWAYLETLFIGSDEVKKELPEDAERFAKVDVKFKAICSRTSRRRPTASNRARSPVSSRNSRRSPKTSSSARRRSPTSSSRSAPSSRASTSYRKRCFWTSSPTATARGSCSRTSTR